MSQKMEHRFQGEGVSFNVTQSGSVTTLWSSTARCLTINLRTRELFVEMSVSGSKVHKSYPTSGLTKLMPGKSPGSLSVSVRNEGNKALKKYKFRDSASRNTFCKYIRCANQYGYIVEELYRNCTNSSEEHTASNNSLCPAIDIFDDDLLLKGISRLGFSNPSTRKELSDLVFQLRKVGTKTSKNLLTDKHSIDNFPVITYRDIFDIFCHLVIENSINSGYGKGNSENEYENSGTNDSPGTFQNLTALGLQLPKQDLIPGENFDEFLIYDQVSLLWWHMFPEGKRQVYVHGRLFITQYRLVFLAFKALPRTSGKASENSGIRRLSEVASETLQAEVPLSNVNYVRQPRDDPTSICLYCKDLRSLTFTFNGSTKVVDNFVSVLENRIYFEYLPNSIKDLKIDDINSNSKMNLTNEKKIKNCEGTRNQNNLDNKVFAFMQPTPKQNICLGRIRADTRGKNSTRLPDFSSEWSSYNPINEFHRMGLLDISMQETSNQKDNIFDLSISSNPQSETPNSTRNNVHNSCNLNVNRNDLEFSVPQNHSQWRLFHNINFKTSPTYPEYLIIPNTQLFSDEDLSAVCAWRSKARFPAVTWHCRKSGVILARSAMPLRGRAGMSNCRADENLCDIYRKSVINSYVSTTHVNTENKQRISPKTYMKTPGKPSNRRRIFGSKWNPDYETSRNRSVSQESLSSTPAFVVIDCRPAINAKATQIIKGGGEEKASRYQNTTLERLYIENIHEMRNSLVELAKICLPGSISDDDNNWLSDVQNTGWLRHIRMVLAGSARVAQLLIAENTSVLVHCSDGWDRTAQICATAQLLVDPYYRTLEGFGVLVEKDWLSFGHKFHDRIGHGQRPRKGDYVHFHH